VIVLAIVGVIGAVAVAVPFLISSDAVKKRISDQLTHWTGRQFTFTGDAKLRLFPYLTVRLQNVRLANPGGKGAFISAGNMTGKLEILPLLAGRLEFAEFRLASPTIALRVDADGQPNWVLDQGVVGTLASKGDSELPADDPAPPTPRADLELGRFLIRNGTVSYSDARNAMNETFSDVNVDLNWQNTIDAATGKGKFTWRGQRVSFTGDVRAPLTLLAGGDSPLRVTAEAAPASLSFDGVARQFDGMQLEGDVSLAVPSVAALAAWLGAPVGDHLVIGSASISGVLSWFAATLSFNNATVNVDGNVGEGALTAMLKGGKPNIQGTLDFARFDFAPQIAAVAASLDAAGAWRQAPIDLPVVRSVDLDLRLSAGQALAGNVEIGPLAASVLVNDGVLLAEVGEAHLGAGQLDASLRATQVDGVLAATASAKGDDVAIKTVAGLFGLSGITGRGEVSTRLSAEGATWGAFAADIAGTVSVDASDGVIEGIDLGRVPAALAGEGTPSPMGGSTGYGRLAANVTAAGGLFATDDLVLESPAYRLDLVGKLALAGPTVEARGVLTLLGEPPRDVPFLVGGPLSAPAFQPDLGAPLPRMPSGEIGGTPGSDG